MNPKLESSDGHPPRAAGGLRVGPGPLRPERRLLPAVPRPVDDLLVREVRPPRLDAGRSAGGEDRPLAWQVRAEAGAPAARHRLRVGGDGAPCQTDDRRPRDW